MAVVATFVCVVEDVILNARTHTLDRVVHRNVLSRAQIPRRIQCRALFKKKKKKRIY